MRNDKCLMGMNHPIFMILYYGSVENVLSLYHEEGGPVRIEMRETAPVHDSGP